MAILRGQDETRVAALVPTRYERMLVSPWTFLRGAAAVMATDLAANPSTGLRVQLCGDAHLSNFGVFAAPDRRLLFDINDFDETHRGPFEWDVKRLAASVVVCSRAPGHDEADDRSAAATAAEIYRRAIADFAEIDTLAAWYHRIEFEDVVGKLKRGGAANAAKQASKDAMRRTSLQAFAKLTHIVHGRRRIIPDPPLVVPLPDDTSAETIERLRDLFASYRTTLPAASRHLLSRFRAADVALKVVGVGNVGTRAFIVLLQGGDGEPLFLQVKEASASVLASHVEGREYDNQGRRVVEGQQLIQGSSDVLLGWTSAPNEVDRPTDFYVRQPRNRKASIDPNLLSADGLVAYAVLCGVALARAHARSGDAAAISGYLGNCDRFAEATADFASSYADQNQRDYDALVEASRNGVVPLPRPQGR